MGIFKRIAVRRQIKRWRCALSLDLHVKHFEQLYQTVNGFEISKSARQENDALEYVYGEIEFEPFIALLSLCKPSTDTVFYDLGSGTGKAVLAMHMVFKLHKSCGIELFPALHACAEAQKARLALYPDYSSALHTVFFNQGDFLGFSLNDADLIFINSTAFFGDYWIRISQYLEQVASGTQLITISKPLKSSAFTCVHSTFVTMSFGPVRAFIQKRL